MSYKIRLRKSTYAKWCYISSYLLENFYRHFSIELLTQLILNIKSHFKLLTRRLYFFTFELLTRQVNLYFVHFWVTNSKLKKEKTHFQDTSSMVKLSIFLFRLTSSLLNLKDIKLNFELLTRKIKQQNLDLGQICYFRTRS